MRKIKELMPPVLIVAGVYFLLYFMGIGCPLKFLTGISCAGCGMTRAYICLLHGDISGALYYHPLFMLPPPVLILILCKKRIPQRIYYLLMFTVIAAFLIIYLLRLLDEGDTVVVFAPKEGLIYRIFDFWGGVK